MNVGIIGYGNMGSSFARGLKEKASRIVVFDITEEKLKKALEDGFGVAKDLYFLVKESQWILLAVKPKDAKSVLENLKEVFEYIAYKHSCGAKYRHYGKLLGEEEDYKSNA